MQDLPLETELSSTFPPPPQHYKLFTDENLLAFKENKYDAIRNVDHSNIHNEENICDPGLAGFFTPPKAPTEGFYQCFHERWKVSEELPSLTEFGIQQLFDTKNGPLCAQERIFELKKMVKSLLLNFLELVGIMGIATDQFVEKVEHIRILLLNIHHLINEYRPHQARHTLCCLIEKQVQDEREKLLACKHACDNVKRILSAHQHILNPEPREQMLVDISETKSDSQTNDFHIWSMIEHKLHTFTHSAQPFDTSVDP